MFEDLTIMQILVMENDKLKEKLILDTMLEDNIIPIFDIIKGNNTFDQIKQQIESDSNSPLPGKLEKLKFMGKYKTFEA